MLADQTVTIRCSGGRFQVRVQVRAPANHLAITLESFSRRQSNVLTANSMAERLGPRSGGTAWAGCDLSRFSPQFDRIFPGEELYPI